jgi:hypothetical protein
MHHETGAILLSSLVNAVGLGLVLAEHSDDTVKFSINEDSFVKLLESKDTG